MLYAALKLRLSLVGSMLSSICASESVTLEWVPLLMQLICSGAVDRQTDTRYITTILCIGLCMSVLMCSWKMHYHCVVCTVS